MVINYFLFISSLFFFNVSDMYIIYVSIYRPYFKLPLLIENVSSCINCEESYYIKFGILYNVTESLLIEVFLIINNIYCLLIYFLLCSFTNSFKLTILTGIIRLLISSYLTTTNLLLSSEQIKVLFRIYPSI